ncbi:MAG: hypothetical protein ACK504_10930 [Bacteroidota bacterium]|jgi:hypothetical protein
MFIKISTFFFLLILLCFCQQNSTKIILKNTHPTFEDVGPIIFKNCTPCHRAGESGPFELMNYEQVKKNANKIKFATQSRYMPPWPADANYTHFIGERILTEEEIETIKVWIEDKMPLGNVSKIPVAPTFYRGSFFGKPDTIVRFKDFISIKGNGTDYFYIVKLPIRLTKDTFVRYFEFVPSHRKLTHHVNGHLINYLTESKKNILNGITYAIDEYKNYKELYLKMNILNDDGSFPTLTPNTVYYLPGYLPPKYPLGIGGYKVNKTSTILLQSIHYGPSNKDVLDSSYINIFYGPKPQRPIFETQLGTFGISKIEPELIIQPNQIQTFTTTATIESDISILSVNPHMHLLGKSFWAFAIKPNSDTIPLIKINHWDFKWQYYYTFPHPIKIQKGTTIKVFGTFDNTSKNPNNPNYPPKKVTQGEGLKSMQTTEEMFQFIFTYLPYQSDDENINLIE